jgi:hypothetical protein
MKAPHDRLFGLPEEHAQPQKSRTMTWPKDWSKHLGETVTVEGTAANLKLGALLQGDGEWIWLEGMSWPNGLYGGGDKGKRVRVTGTVIKNDDLPVFVVNPGWKPGELVPQGMSVRSEEELRKAKWRFLLRDAKWTVLE